MRPLDRRKSRNRLFGCVYAAWLFLAVPGSLLSAQIPTAQNRGIAGTVKLKGAATTIQRIEVTLLSSDRRPMERVFADTLGAFQFLGLNAGVYIIVIDEPGYQRLEDTVEIPPRSVTLQRRYYVLEPKAPTAAPVDLTTVSAQRFLVAKDARDLLAKGERELSKRRYEAAAEHLDRALAIAPNFADALHARAVIYLQQNNLTRAQQFFEKAVSSNPQLGDAHIGLGSALNRQGHAEGALEPLTKGLALNPHSYLGRFERCRAYFQLGRLELAEADCHQALALAGSPRPELRILLGNLYLRQGRSPEALREFEAYLLRGDSSSATAAQVRSVVKALRDAGVTPPR